MAQPRQSQRAEGQASHGDHRYLVNPPAQNLHQRNNYTDKVLVYQTIIHITFFLSAMAIAYTDKLMSGSEHEAKKIDGRANKD